MLTVQRFRGAALFLSITLAASFASLGSIAINIGGGEFRNTSSQPLAPGSLLQLVNLGTTFYPTLPTGYRKFSTHGFDIAKGRWVDLTLILKNT